MYVRILITGPHVQERILIRIQHSGERLTPGVLRAVC
jgi:hypothetical protein